MKRLARNRILLGDVRERLLDLPAASIDCVITSPPYYQLRDYGIDGQLGLESTVEGWVNELRLALNGLTRVLKPSGSLWLNLGDSYSRHTKYGAPPKGLLLARSYPLGSAGIGSRRGIAALMGWIVTDYSRSGLSAASSSARR